MAAPPDTWVKSRRHSTEYYKIYIIQNKSLARLSARIMRYAPHNAMWLYVLFSILHGVRVYCIGQHAISGLCFNVLYSILH